MGVQGAKSPAGVWGTLPGGQVTPRNLLFPFVRLRRRQIMSRCSGGAEQVWNKWALLGSNLWPLR